MTENEAKTVPCISLLSEAARLKAQNAEERELRNIVVAFQEGFRCFANFLHQDVHPPHSDRNKEDKG